MKCLPIEICNECKYCHEAVDANFYCHWFDGDRATKKHAQEIITELGYDYKYEEIEGYGRHMYFINEDGERVSIRDEDEEEKYHNELVDKWNREDIERERESEHHELTNEIMENVDLYIDPDKRYLCVDEIEYFEERRNGTSGREITLYILDNPRMSREEFERINKEICEESGVDDIYDLCFKSCVQNAFEYGRQSEEMPKTSPHMEAIEVYRQMMEDFFPNDADICIDGKTICYRHLGCNHTYCK